MLVVWPPLCTGGNGARGHLSGSSIVKIAGTGPGEVILEIHLHMGKAQGLSTELPNQELAPSESILAKGLQ
jgi:hypothetical protein